MMARITLGGSTGKTRLVLPALTIFFMCCLVFSGTLYALAAEEVSSEPAATKSEVSKPAVIEDAQLDAAAELEAILKKNKKCLMCHKREKFKTLEDGGELSLQVHVEDYLGSVHGEVACVGCHTAIGNRKHPSSKTNITINSQREYSLELNESCRECHAENTTQYEGSIHASMIARGSEKAPVCTDCHSSHAIQNMAEFQSEPGVPCITCHESIYDAYAESVHGQAVLHGNVIRDTHIQAPVCADCHRAHDVTALEIGDTLRTTCIACHENVDLLHNQWLPNSGVHLDVISCAVCHAPFAQNRFDLHLFDNSTQLPVGQKETDEFIQEQLKAFEESDGSRDLLEFFTSVTEGEIEGTLGNISVRGRMETKSGVSAHQIASMNFARRTCDSCHRDDRQQKQNLTVSVPGVDGRVQRFETDREALSSVKGVESMSDFYALGGNTNKLLDIMFLLSLAAGIAVPIGHFTLGRMVKEKMDKGEL